MKHLALAAVLLLHVSTAHAHMTDLCFLLLADARNFSSGLFKPQTEEEERQMLSAGLDVLFDLEEACVWQKVPAGEMQAYRARWERWHKEGWSRIRPGDSDD